MKQSSQAMQSLEFSLPPKEFMFISRKFIGAYTFLTVLDARTSSRTLIDSITSSQHNVIADDMLDTSNNGASSTDANSINAQD